MCALIIVLGWFRFAQLQGELSRTVHSPERLFIISFPPNAPTAYTCKVLLAGTKHECLQGGTQSANHGVVCDFSKRRLAGPNFAPWGRFNIQAGRPVNYRRTIDRAPEYVCNTQYMSSEWWLQCCICINIQWMTTICVCETLLCFALLLRTANNRAFHLHFLIFPCVTTRLIAKTPLSEDIEDKFLNSNKFRARQKPGNTSVLLVRYVGIH